MHETSPGLTSEQKHFALRRIHSLLGIVPLGGFLFFHLFENSRVMFGERAYNEMVDTIGGLPYLKLIEWGAIFLPILLHGIYGVFIALGAKNILRHEIYNRLGTWRFWFQRGTGVFLIAFLVYHVGSTRIALGYLGLHGQHSPSFAFMAEHFAHSPWVKPFYALGIAAAAYHLGNGLWSFAITWGVTIRKASQDTVLKFVSLPVFLVVIAMGWYTLFRFAFSSGTDLPPLPSKTALLSVQP